MRTSVLTRPTVILSSLPLLLGLGWCLSVGPRLKAGAPSAHAAAAMPDQTVQRAMEAAHRDFRQYCARCHDNDFTGHGWRQRGRRIPDFTNGPWHASRTDDQLFVSILEGKGVSMPGFSDTLSEEQSRRPVTPDPTSQPDAFGDVRDRPTGIHESLPRIDRAARSPAQTISRVGHHAAEAGNPRPLNSRSRSFHRVLVANPALKGRWWLGAPSQKITRRSPPPGRPANRDAPTRAGWLAAPGMRCMARPQKGRGVKRIERGACVFRGLARVRCTRRPQPRHP